MNLYLIAQATQPSGWTPEAISALTTALVALVAAIGAAVAAVIAALRGTSAKATADASQQSLTRLSNRATAQDERVSRVERDMAPPVGTHRPPTPLLLLPLLLIPMFAGCVLFNPKSAQEDKVAAAEKTFASTVTALTQLRKDGKVSDKDWARAREISEGIDAAFDALHDDLDAGKKVDVDTVLKGIRASLDRLATYRTEATRESGRASTPVGPVGFGRNAGQERVYARAA